MFHQYTRTHFQPISFKSLPNSMHIHENYDDPFEIHLIITYDYNNPQHDNVTCAMTVSPDEDNMFELVHEGFFKYDCKYTCTFLTHTSL